MSKHRFLCNKLVRDLIPELMQNSEIEMPFSVLDDAQYQKALIAKLQEEVKEVVCELNVLSNSNGISQRIEEALVEEALPIEGESKNSRPNSNANSSEHPAAYPNVYGFSESPLSSAVTELADVMEVIYSICDAFAIQMEDIENRRIAKKTINGGFHERLYAMYVELDDKSEKFAYYKNRPDDYPEIDCSEISSQCDDFATKNKLKIN